MANGETGEDRAQRRFGRKLQTFVSDYQLDERPALVLQAGPADAEHEVDLTSTVIRVALAQGGDDSSNTWWNGLQAAAGTLRGSVDGLAAVSAASPPIWASELHTDGHLIAGIWDFERGDPQRPLITWDYAELFDDFGRLAEKVARQASSEQAIWWVTATLLRANTVHYGSEADRRSNRLTPPLRRPQLDFRFRRGVGPQGLRSAVQLTRRDFRRAYAEPH